MSITVRHCAPSDQGAICALWARVFGYTEARNDPAKVLAGKLSWDGRVLVAAEADRLLGALMVGYDGHRGWLYRMAVDADVRRRGIGRELVRAAEQHLAALGCTKVNLQLHTANEAGARFWESVGYGREARIDMGKNLTQGA